MTQSSMHVGIDMSLSSPGVAICTFSENIPVQKQFHKLNERFFTHKKRRREDLDVKGQVDQPLDDVKWSFLAFVQRKTDILCKDARITLCSKIIRNHSDVDRYTYITESILTFITNVQLKQNVDIAKTRIFIEGYAFKTTGTGSSFKLHELGGVLRYVLCKAGFPSSSIQTLYPTEWKSCNVGVKASKFDTLCHVRPVIDLQEVFVSTCSKDKTVPNPQQDIADAIGITLASFCISK